MVVCALWVMHVTGHGHVHPGHVVHHSRRVDVYARQAFNGGSGGFIGEREALNEDLTEKAKQDHEHW